MKEVDKATDELVRLENVMQKRGDGGYEFETDVGTIIGWAVYKDPDLIEIGRMFMSKGSKFPGHDHPPSVEIMLMYEGAARFHWRNDAGKIVESFDMVLKSPVIIEPGRKHSLSVQADSKFLLVWMPPDTTIQIEDDA